MTQINLEVINPSIAYSLRTSSVAPISNHKMTLNSIYYHEFVYVYLVEFVGDTTKMIAVETDTPSFDRIRKDASSTRQQCIHLLNMIRG